MATALITDNSTIVSWMGELEESVKEMNSVMEEQEERKIYEKVLEIDTKAGGYKITGQLVGEGSTHQKQNREVFFEGEEFAEGIENVRDGS